MIDSFIMTTMDYNVPAHASRLMQSFLAKHQITQVTQPLYSLDLAPCDLWLFPKLKSPLKGRDFRPSVRGSGKYDGAADGDWSQGAYFVGD